METTFTSREYSRAYQRYSYQPAESGNVSGFLQSQPGRRSLLRIDTVSLTYTRAEEATYNATLDSPEGTRDGYNLLRGLVLDIFETQGLGSTIEISDGELDAGSISPEKAEELIAIEGYFGVEKTSERIFQFAVGIAGGDRGKLDLVRQGVDDGLQEALDLFKGYLPQICYDTYDAVMQKLDNWAGEGSPEPKTQVM